MAKPSNDHWNTPPEVLERVGRIGAIALDPCSNATSIVQALAVLDGFDGDDGLDADWLEAIEDANHTAGAIVYVNPPYSDPAPWAAKCIAEAARGVESILLVPSDSGVRWFQTAWRNCDAVCLPDRRLAFLGPKGKPVKGNRGSSAIFYFGERSKRFLAAFHDFGVTVVRTQRPSAIREAAE